MAKKIVAQEDCPLCGEQPCACVVVDNRKRLRSTDPLREVSTDAQDQVQEGEAAAG